MTKFWLISVTLCSLLLTACSGDMEDLKAEVARIKARRNNQVDPIPTFVVVPKFFYPTDVEKLRDPFKSFLEEVTDNARSKITTESLQMNCPHPDPYRVRTGLEKMPLDALQMVGILENQEEMRKLEKNRLKNQSPRLKLWQNFGGWWLLKVMVRFIA